MTETNLQIFTHNIHGTVTTLEINAEAYFKAKDVAEMLGYADPAQAVRDIVDAEDKFTLNNLLGQGVVQNTTPWHNMQPYTIFVNESGLYSLILRSTKPEAKKIKHWVTSEVLPSIRKTGSYMHHIHPQNNIPTTSKIPTALLTIAKAYTELADVWGQEHIATDTKSSKQTAAKFHTHQQTPEIQFLTSWWDCVDNRDVTAKDLYRIITNQQCPKLQQAAIELFGPVENWTSRKLGNILRNWSHQELSEYVVLNLGKNKAGTIWRLEHKQ